MLFTIMEQHSKYTILALLLCQGLLVVSQLEFSEDPLYDRTNLQYLFYRPLEPVFTPKGINDDVLFELPEEYWPDRYQPIASSIEEQYNELNATRIKVPKVRIPDLSLPMKLGRREHFSPFIPHHRRMAQRLIDVLMGAKSYEDFLSRAVFCRTRINPFMYVYALSVAILHRPDTNGLSLPPYHCLFPEKYFSGEVFSMLREEASVVRPQNRIPVEIPQEYTATDMDPEHRLAYWREDIGINMHHWHWHLLYPFSGPVSVVNKDRRGELFQYTHNQIMARHNFERFSNKLSRVKKLNNFREPIAEAYFPKLDSLVASRVWPSRQEYTRLSDVRREDQQLVYDILDLERWRSRIYDSIHDGFVETERGELLLLSEEHGIDILGNIVESSVLSINRNYYGDLHNLGHIALAYSHDPDNKHLEPVGVMGDPTTAMRDPVFYRWHAFTSDIFAEYKATLPSYNEQQLGFDNIRVTDVQVIVHGGQLNEFLTFWEQSNLDLSRGLDFTPGGPLLVKITHLQHLPFMYRIQIMNSGQPRMGTIRIFMAPKFDERGLPFRLEEQRVLFIELDKFQVRLHNGRNVIERLSSESSVSVPSEQTFSPTDADTNTNQVSQCGCGWPQHMLIPKGTPEGLAVDLFVMVSNYMDDRVPQRPTSNSCQDGHSYCGIRGQLYPDRRAMGFPFDRLPVKSGMTLQDFLTPNMWSTNVTIRFTGHRVLTGK